VVCALAVLVGALNTACSRNYVVVPHPEDGYSRADTLYGYLNGDEIRVTFWFDTIMRVDTVVRLDTLWREGTRTVTRVDTVVRLDTLWREGPHTVEQVATITRADTVLDTVRVAITETVVDTLLRVDTVRVKGQRVLFVPPGHYPPEGLCRVWIYDRPPGRQAKPAPCDALGEIPAGAFILFGGDAWDFDYDWVAEAAAHPGSVPPEIVALKRHGR
jgi:hypothetical protein